MTVPDLARAARSVRRSQAEAIRDVEQKIARLKKRLAEWRAVLKELRKDDYR